MLLIEIHHQPEFVLVMGGAGSGKNHFISTSKYKNYHLIDVDEYKMTRSLNDAMAMVKTEMTHALSTGKDVVHPTTGSHLKGQENKITRAKEAGYRVTLILKDTPVDVALKQVKKRSEIGGHSVKEADIIASNEKARANFKILKALADEARIV